MDGLWSGLSATSWVTENNQIETVISSLTCYVGRKHPKSRKDSLKKGKTSRFGSNSELRLIEQDVDVVRFSRGRACKQAESV